MWDKYERASFRVSPHIHSKEVSVLDSKKRRAIFKKGAETMERLDLEPTVIADVPRLELTGNRALYMDRHRGILSYSTESIDIGGGSVIVRVQGFDLQIVAMTDDELRIAGRICGLELIE